MRANILDDRPGAAILFPFAAIVIPIILSLFLTITLQNPANAQSTVFEERHRVSGWEEPLCAREGNLRHYYWTEIDASSRYRANAINRVAPSGRASYKIISRTAGPNSRPAANLALSARGKRMSGEQLASGDVSGVLRPGTSGNSGSGRGASTSTYASYSQGSRPVYQYDGSRNVSGRVLSY